MRIYAEYLHFKRWCMGHNHVLHTPHSYRNTGFINVPTTLSINTNTSLRSNGLLLTKPLKTKTRDQQGVI